VPPALTVKVPELVKDPPISRLPLFVVMVPALLRAPPMVNLSPLLIVSLPPALMVTLEATAVVILTVTVKPLGITTMSVAVGKVAVPQVTRALFQLLEAFAVKVAAFTK